MNSSESTAPIREPGGPRSVVAAAAVAAVYDRRPVVGPRLPASGGLALQIKTKARELGFDLVGIATAQPPGHSREFQQWLASGYHGEMGYMAKTAEKRVDPTRILANARSVVVVGLNYYSDRSDGSPHLDPLPRTTGERGQVRECNSLLRGLGSPYTARERESLLSPVGWGRGSR